MTKDNIKTTPRIAIFASGAGSNAARLMQYFEGNTMAEIALIVTNNPKAGVVASAQKYDIFIEYINKNLWLSPNDILTVLRTHEIDFVVLAGFLWRVPAELVSAFPQRIVNLHPSLLPKFGGKGMYGMHVHTAVVAAGETETGITIHYVNEAYDEGAIIAQYYCPVATHDTPETVAENIRKLEEKHFVATILEVLTQTDFALTKV
jgi:phosphoribosylglycinamide formyltransferase 1